MLDMGTYTVGILTDFRSEPWSSDSSKFNHRLIISRPYQDQFGNQQTDVSQIDVNQDDVQAVQSQMTALRGKQVVCPVVYAARAGGRTGAWLSVRLPKHAVILPFESVLRTDIKKSA